ncbi:MULTISPECIES: DUF2442 domain-containing protein [Halomonas]|uniref:Uncharacterized protein DUF2442 n=1 Tax=Halomonas ventosae TaxID=229007 RepID=A0A4R6GQ63_9GAMM|nr:DUF2442 domain-containing protein [Halomonas ventosae]TDN97293.1 uncharacterized protein DUF2442 [Halomonas ventosae]
MHPSVISLRPLENYSLAITFDNGGSGVLDMDEYLDFGVFQHLKDRKAFENVKVSFVTFEWESGVDLDSEFVYRNCTIQ